MINKINYGQTDPNEYYRRSSSKEMFVAKANILYLFRFIEFWLATQSWSTASLKTKIIKCLQPSNYPAWHMLQRYLNKNHKWLQNQYMHFKVSSFLNFGGSLLSHSFLSLPMEPIYTEHVNSNKNLKNPFCVLVSEKFL